MMDIVERLNVAREGMEAGIDDWPLESRIYEYKKAAEEITELRAFKAACEKQEAVLTEEMFDCVLQESELSFKRHCRSIRGQMITVLDMPDYHVASAALRLFGLADPEAAKLRQQVAKLTEQRDTAVEFVEEVRRSGDTRLASMAIATLSKLEVRK